MASVRLVCGNEIKVKISHITLGMQCSTHCFVPKSTHTTRCRDTYNRRSKAKRPFVVSIKEHLIPLMPMFILIMQSVMQLIPSLQLGVGRLILSQNRSVLMSAVFHSSAAETARRAVTGCTAALGVSRVPVTVETEVSFPKRLDPLWGLPCLLHHVYRG